MPTLYTEVTNNNKYEETEKHGLSMEKNRKHSSNCFCWKAWTRYPAHKLNKCRKNMASLPFESVFALSHSLCSHLPSPLESRKDKIANIFMTWNQNYTQQKTHLWMDYPQDNNSRILPKTTAELIPTRQHLWLEPFDYACILSLPPVLWLFTSVSHVYSLQMAEDELSTYLPLPTAYPKLCKNSPFPAFTMLLYLTFKGDSEECDPCV
jgi:hypothetical protein